MIDILKEIESKYLFQLLQETNNWKSVNINYHPPFVKRLYTDINYNTGTETKQYRISLHYIEQCTREEALYHPHPWPSAIHILEGKYEMGIGYGPKKKLIKEVCKLELSKGDYYEMIDPDGWHYVQPLTTITKTIMINDKPWNRWSPKSEEKLQPLSDIIKLNILSYFYFEIEKLISK